MSIPQHRVREFAPHDRPALTQILLASEPWITLGYGAKDWERLFSAIPASREGYVIESGGMANGIAVLRTRVFLGDYLELLAVAPEKRGQGMGAALLAHVEGVAFARAKNLFVCVSDFNDGACRFYEHHGYQLIGPIPDLVVTGRSELLMRKTIGPVRGW